MTASDTPPRRYRRHDGANKPGCVAGSKNNHKRYGRPLKAADLSGLPTISDKHVKEFHKTGRPLNEEEYESEFDIAIAAMRAAIGLPTAEEARDHDVIENYCIRRG